MTRGASREALTRKHGGKWCAQEHAGHLVELERLWIARVGDFLGPSGTLTPADLSNRQTDEAGYHKRPLAEILSAFRSERGRLLHHVERLEPGLLGRALVHPRLKQPMRLIDHLYFVAEHDDHHLAKIWELIEADQA